MTFSGMSLGSAAVHNHHEMWKISNAKCGNEENRRARS